MPTSWGWLRARLTARRSLALVAGAGALTLAPVILLVGVAVGQLRIAAIVSLGVFVIVIVAVIAGATWALRRYRLVRTGLEGEVIDVTGPSRGAADGGLRTLGAERVRIGIDRARTPAHMIAAFGMSSRSPVARDQLAGSATGWRFDYDSLAEVVRHLESPSDRLAAVGPSDPATLLLLARTVASQQLEPDDDEVARGLIELVAAHPARDGLSLSARRLLIERLASMGATDSALELLGRDGGSALADRLVVADLLNPFGDRDGDPGAWLAVVNGIYRRAGLEPLHLDGDGPTPFDRLRATPEASDPAGAPLVTVIMTTYRPDRAALSTAVLSIIGQSWTAWELVIADDGSPAEFDAVLNDVSTLDARITVTRSATNDGTYARRNEAMRGACGEFVTFLDSDDWAHPRRLELQLDHLARHPGSPANLSRSARVTDELRFLHERGSLLRLTEASLLFRREAVLSAVGFFDAVRKAADTGFRLRIEAWSGRQVPIVDVEAPLTLARYRSASLSGGELRDGWTHPARVAYSSALAAWIRAERAAGRPPYLPEHQEARPFPAHASLLGREPSPIDLDVLYVLDVRADRRSAAIDREVLDAARSGLRVGIRRAERIRSEGVSAHARGGLQGAINAGRVVETIPGDDVSARLVVVLDASVLVGVGPGTPIRAERVVAVRHPSITPAEAEEGVARLTGSPVVDVTDLNAAAQARRALASQ